MLITAVPGFDAGTASAVSNNLVVGSSVDLAPLKRHVDEGFTLVELLVVMVIVAIVAGATSLSLASVSGARSNATHLIGTSADALIVAASLIVDVQSATEFTTKSTPTAPVACGTDSQVLGLLWSTSGSTNTIVSYGLVPNDTMYAAKTGVEDNLVRYLCTSANGGTPTLRSTSILSHDVPAGLTALASGESCTTTLCSTASAASTSGWVSTVGLQNVKLVVNEALTKSVSYDQSCSVDLTSCYLVAAAPHN